MREHDDLDLVVLRDQLVHVRAALARAGFTVVVRDWLPTAFALADAAGRSVDLHPIVPTPDGGGDQSLPDGGSFHYSAPVHGRINGNPVLCVDGRTQLLCHSGYTLDDVDRQDVAHVRRVLGL